MFTSSNETLLDWSDFVWKQHPTVFVKGVSKWLDCEEDILIGLKSIGCRPGIKLTSLGEIKLPSAIRRATTSDVRTLISDTKQENENYETFRTHFPAAERSTKGQ